MCYEVSGATPDREHDGQNMLESFQSSQNQQQTEHVDMSISLDGHLKPSLLPGGYLREVFRRPRD